MNESGNVPGAVSIDEFEELTSQAMQRRNKLQHLQTRQFAKDLFPVILFSSLG
jgi:hypothetical protein